jgi:sugar phosphate isomerase/epimerase
MNNPIGVVSCHIHADNLPEHFTKARAWGMNSIEWFEGDRPGPTEPDQAAQIVALSARHGIAATYHAPWMGPWDLGVKTAAQAADTLGELIARAGRIQAKLMTVHMGSHPPAADRQRSLENLAAALNAVAPQAEAAGVTICLENFTLCYSPNDLAGRTSDFEFIFAAVASPAVGMNLDVGHANITGNTRELIARFGRRLCNTHLHDTDGVTDGHLPPGGGTIDWPGLLGQLKPASYAGPLNFEFGQTPDGAYERLIGLIRSIS